MKYLIDLILKIIGSILMAYALGMLVAIALIFWNEKYMKIAENLYNEIMDLLWRELP